MSTRTNHQVRKAYISTYTWNMNTCLYRIVGSVDEKEILLLTVDSRDDWEVMFSEKFLIPTTQVCHNVITQEFFIIAGI